MSRRASLTAMATLAAVLLAYFSRVWTGAVFLPTDMVFEFPFFRAAAPDGFSGASSALLSDVVLKFHPWRLAVWESMQRWQLPFWNPFIFCGAPLLANGETAVFYPLSLLTLLLPPERAVAVSAMLRLGLAGGGMFAFLRALNLHPAAALLGAITFMLSGSSIVWLHYPVSNVYVCLPLLCASVELWITTRRRLYLPLLAAGMTMQLLGGHPQTSFIVLLIVTAYAALRVTALRERHLMVGGAMAGATLVGFLGAAIHLLPFWHWLQHTAEWHLRAQERAAALLYPGWWKELISAPILLVLPNFFGNPRWWRESFFYANYIELAVYVGIIPLAFALLAAGRSLTAPSRNEHRLTTAPVRFFVLLALGSAVLALRFPGVDLINHVPPLNVLPPGRYRLALTFALAVLGGIGFDQFLHDPPDTPRRARLGVVVAAIALFQIALLLGAYLVLTTATATLLRFDRIRLAYPVLVQVFAPGYWGMYFPVAATVMAVVACRRRAARTPRFTIVAALLSTIVDLYAFGHDFNPTTTRDAVFPRTPPADFLATHAREVVPDRIVALADDLPPNTAMPYHLYEITGSDFPSARYLALMQALGAQVLPGHNRIRFEAVSQRLLDLLNVRYVLRRATPRAPEPPLRTVYADADVMILENPAPLPRVSIMHRATTLHDSAAVLERLQSPDFDPYTELLVEDLVPAATLPPDPPREESVAIRRYAANRVSIAAELATAGFVYLADAYDPGWQVQVDGEERPLYRANYAFRAVHLSAGRHEIELTYTAPGFVLGLVLSALSLTLLTVSLVACVVWPERRRSVPLRNGTVTGQAHGLTTS